MPTKNPRVNVTFNPSDAECIELICKKKKISMSGLVRKVVEDWLEEYEDMLLARRAEKAEEEWIKDGCKTITHEELCQELGIKSNMDQNQVPKNIQERIIRAIEERLPVSPENGKPLTKEWKGHRRMRVGDYRVIYKIIEDKIIVFIVEIDHRKDIYNI